MGAADTPSTRATVAVASASLTLRGADFAAGSLAMRASARRAAPRAPRARRVVTRAQGNPNLRPYTLRKGDTLETLAQQRSIHDLLRELTPDPGQPADQFTRFLHPLIEEGYEEIDDLDSGADVVEYIRTAFPVWATESDRAMRVP